MSDNFKELTLEEARLKGFETDEPNGTMIFALTGVIVISLVATLFAVYWYFTLVNEKTYETKVLSTISPELREVRKLEDSRLNRYSKVLDDKGQAIPGRVSLPVSAAMDVFLKESNNGTVWYKTNAAPVVPYEGDTNLTTIFGDRLKAAPQSSLPGAGILPEPVAAAGHGAHGAGH
jgi:hypothetical protein